MEKFRCDPFNIVAFKYTQVFEGRDPRNSAKFAQELAGLGVKLRLLLNVNAFCHVVPFAGIRL